MDQPTGELGASAEARRRRIEELERLEREGYERIPDDPEEFAFWTQQASWPDDCVEWDDDASDEADS